MEEVSSAHDVRLSVVVVACRRLTGPELLEAGRSEGRRRRSTVETVDTAGGGEELEEEDIFELGCCLWTPLYSTCTVVLFCLLAQQRWQRWQ